MMRLAILLCGLAACAGHDSYDYTQLIPETNKLMEENTGSTSKRVVCYVAMYSDFRHPGGGKYADSQGAFNMKDVNAKLCTHINFGFVTMCSKFADSFDHGQDAMAEAPWYKLDTKPDIPNAKYAKWQGR